MQTVKGALSAPEQLILRLLRDALDRHGCDQALVEEQLSEPSAELVDGVDKLVSRHFNRPDSPNRDAVLACPPVVLADDWWSPLQEQLDRLLTLTSDLPRASVIDATHFALDDMPGASSVGPVVLLPKHGWLASLLAVDDRKYRDFYSDFHRATRWSVDWMERCLAAQFVDSSAWRTDKYTRTITGITCDARQVERRRVLESSQPGTVMAVAVDLCNSLGGGHWYSPRRAGQEIERQGRYGLSLVDLAWIATLNPRLVTAPKLSFSCPFGRLEGSSSSTFERDGGTETTFGSVDGIYCLFIENGKMTLGSDLRSDMLPVKEMPLASFAPLGLV